MLHPHYRIRTARAFLLSGAVISELVSCQAKAEWPHDFSLRAEEGYDSNIFLQKVMPLANHDSFITVIQPKVDKSEPVPELGLPVCLRMG